MESTNYIIKEITIGDTDFSTAWNQIVFFEDIFTNEMSGYIEVMETESVREQFEGLPDGIIGEEKVHLSFASKFPNGTEHETIDVDFVVNKIADFRQNTLEQKLYKLHFVSQYHDANIGHRNRKYWEGTSDDIVTRIVEKQLGAKMNMVDTSKYTNEIVFPNLMPYQVANFLSDMSISSNYNDPKYLFYECRDGFNFVSLSHLMEQSPIHTMTSEIFSDAGDQSRFNVQSFATKTVFDSLMNEFTGMFGNTLITFDKIKQEIVEKVNTYSDTFDQFKHVGETKLTKNLEESGKNKFQFMLAGNEESPNTYTHTDEWAGQLLNRANQVKNNTMVVTYTGNTNLKVGKTVEFDLKSSKGKGDDADKKLSGKYLITRLKHVIDRLDYKTMVEIAKDGFKS